MTFTATTFSSTTFRCCFEKKPLPSARMRRRMINIERSRNRRDRITKEDYLENNMNNNSESSQTLKLSVQDRLRMGKNMGFDRSCVWEPVRERDQDQKSSSTGKTCTDCMMNTFPTKIPKAWKKEVVSSELILQKSAFAVEMAVKDSVDLFRGDDVGK